MHLPNKPQLSQSSEPDHVVETREFLRKDYFADRRPWVVAYSGGKDSTLVLQLVYELIQELGSKASKPIHVVASDTRVEAPNIEHYLADRLSRIESHAKANGLPVRVHRVQPAPDQSFWGNLIGSGTGGTVNDGARCRRATWVPPGGTSGIALWHAEQQCIEAGDLDYESFIGSVDASIQAEIQRVQQEGLALAIDAVQCPRCQEGALRKRKGSKGVFWGCGRYPDCRATYPDGKPDLSGGVTVSTEHACPKCRKGLIRREAKAGKGAKGNKGTKGATYWWGCSGFPACDYRTFDDAGKPKPQ